MQNFDFTGTVRLKEREQDIGAMDFGFAEGAREIYSDVYHMNATIGQGKTIDLNTTSLARANFFAIRCERPIYITVNQPTSNLYKFMIRDFMVMQCDQITLLKIGNAVGYRKYPNKVRIWIGAQGKSGD